MIIVSEYGSLFWIGSPYGSPSTDVTTTLNSKFFPFLFVMVFIKILLVTGNGN